MVGSSEMKLVLGKLEEERLWVFQIRMALMESSCAFVCNVKQYNKFKILADCMYVTHDVDAHESLFCGV